MAFTPRQNTQDPAVLETASVALHYAVELFFVWIVFFLCTNVRKIAMPIMLSRGCGIARVLANLYEGVCNGDPISIVISLVLVGIVVAIVVLKLKGYD